MKKYTHQSSNETTPLGTYIHTCESNIILKLTCDNIPYPNSPVLLQNRIIGKVDEVFGTLENAYCSVICENEVKVDEKSMFNAYMNKFIVKSRFLLRTEVEKKKEKNDKEKRNGTRTKGEVRNREGNNRFKEGNSRYKEGSNRNAGKKNEYGDSKRFKRSR